MEPKTREDVLEFWFGTSASDAAVAREKSALWWGAAGAELDREISARFGEARESAVTGRLKSWEETPQGRLALIVLVDQFSRNIFRGKALAFEHDALARTWCAGGIALGHDRALRRVERVFFYLPLEHSETLADQARSLELFGRLASEVPASERERFDNYLDFARRHHAIVERFGRFPHRNAVLGRDSTPEELEFLCGPGSSF